MSIKAFMLVLILLVGAIAATPSPMRESADRAVIIPIRDEITEITQDSVVRRLKHVREAHIPLVIFEFNTPGGALMPTLEICHAIKSLRDEGVKVYAWINNQAYSAGAIIALATDGVVMVSDATIGDCKPIMITPGGASGIPEDLEAKVTSPPLAELRDSARRNGYDLNLINALIDEKVEVFWVVNTETSEKRFVDATERDELFGLPPTPKVEREKSDSSRPRRDPVPDSRSKTAWKYVKEAPGLGKVRQPIDGDHELLTMRTVEAQAYGFSIATLNSEPELRTYFKITGTIERMDLTWIETTVEWLASPMVRGVLFLLMLLGAYAELQHPGFGVPAAVALIALILFLGAPYMAGFTVTWEIVAILLGLILLGVEVFVIPGFGVAGIMGFILLAVGLLSSFVPPEPDSGHWPHWPTMPGSFEYMKHGLWALAAGMGGSIFGMALIARYLPKVPIAGRLVAPNPTHAQVMVADAFDGAGQVGQIGLTEGPLRPAGKARFDDRLIDVISEGDYIDKNTRVEVTQRSGNRVVVRRVN